MSEFNFKEIKKHIKVADVYSVLSGSTSPGTFVNKMLKGPIGDMLESKIAAIISNVPLEDGELGASVMLSVEDGKCHLNLVTWIKENDKIMVGRNLFEYPMNQIGDFFTEINTMKRVDKQIDFRAPEVVGSEESVKEPIVTDEKTIESVAEIVSKMEDEIK